MRSRGKALAIESIVVMLVLVVFAFVVFLIIDAGSGAYDKILGEKDRAQSARVAYSYIDTKIKQNDTAGCVSVIQTEYGDTLKIDTSDGAFSTYIFYDDGALFECLAKKDKTPKVSAANIITDIGELELRSSGNIIYITCTCGKDEHRVVVEGMVGLRS